MENFSSKNFIHGYLAGMAGIVVSHPFDTIKTNYQEGKRVSIRHLYRGVVSPFFGVGLEKAVVFGVYSSTRELTGSDIISGSLSGLSASLVVTPFERLKILLQTGQSLSGLKINTLFNGLSATLTRETPGFALYFSIYNFLKGDLNSDIHPLRSFTYGALAGTGAWIFIYPQDRIKTHIQASKNRNIGFIQSIHEINKSSNNTNIIKTFYKGFSLALIRAIPLHATAFTTMELLKKYF